MLAYYSCAVVQDSAFDQTRIWIFALSDYVFMVEAMFIVNAKDGACLTYYAGNLWFNNLSDQHLFWLPAKSFDALASFG